MLQENLKELAAVRKNESIQFDILGFFEICFNSLQPIGLHTSLPTPTYFSLTRSFIPVPVPATVTVTVTVPSPSPFPSLYIS